MKKQKRLSLWLDKDLANVFQKLNHKVNKSLFEHEFRFCFSIYHISYIDSSELLNFRPQSFSNPDKIIKIISEIILRIHFINNQIENVTEELAFLESYI